MEDIPLEIPDNHEEQAATDSYDELAKGASAEVAPEPTKRGRGRPLGAKNKPKPPEPEEFGEEPPTPRHRKAKTPASIIAPLDVAFDEGYGGAGPPPRTPLDRDKPVRVKRTPAAARPLMERGPSARAKKQSFFTLVAEATRAHSARERETRRNFYESFLPM